MSQKSDSNPPPSQPRGPLILFVDDDVQLLEAYRDRFLHFGYQVIVSSNGKDAIEMLSKFKVDLAVLDVAMPGMDGFKLIKALREIAPNLPTVFLTGRKDRDILLKAFELRSNSLVEKPCTPQELEFQISRLLAGSRRKAS